MLTPESIKKINEFVYKQPRSIKEISELIKCSWVTADKYTNKISEKYGTIKVKVFRGGTKGALKIVYWANLEGMRTSTAQQVLLNKIKAGRKKHDFNPFDIYNLVEKEKRITKVTKTTEPEKQEIIKLIKNATNQLFIFSGNLSFANNKENNKEIIDVIKEIAKRKVNIKVLCRVDIASIKNIKKIIEINKILGYNVVEIRHIEQPLRGFIIDDKIVRLREEKRKKDYKEGEINNDLYVLYDIYDKEWVEWIEKVFFNLHSNALPSENRIKDLEEVEELLVHEN